MNEGKVCWDFPLLGTGNQSGSNIAAITMFKGVGIMDGMGRENGQNSEDAKDKELPDDVPVKMEFELVYINKKEYLEFFDGYAEALKNCFDFWKINPNSTPQIMEFLANVKKSLGEEEIPLLVVRDFNTTGLNGVNAAPDEKSYWDLLVNTEGISVKQDKDSAGSYGIGKNAPFAYSGLNLILYNTLAKDGGRAFEGVTRLVTSQREYNGEMRKTQPIGKYLYLIDTFTGRPILPEDNCKIASHPAFRREEGQYGTDVGVVGFKLGEYPDWEKALAISMLKNFVMAIIEGKLLIEIKSFDVTYTISKDTIEKLLFETLKDEEQLRYTRQIYETVKNPDKDPINFKIAEDNDLTIYVKYKDSYYSSLSRFRAGGMLINTTTNDVFPHFSVVVVANTVGEKILSETLRASEPPQHTEWKAKNITDNRELHNKAAKFIREIGKCVARVMEEFDDGESSGVLDSGTGGYIPDITRSASGEDGNDGLRTDLKIREIISKGGEILYDNRYVQGEKAEGEPTEETGHKTGKKKRKKKKKDKIPVVDPSKGEFPGVSSGNGKVRLVTPNITDHRTFYEKDGIYHMFVDCPEAYENVYVRYYAGRDDGKEDNISVKKCRIGGIEYPINENGIAGPIQLVEGKNDVYIEFMTGEMLAVIPVFAMEVRNEE